MCVPVCTFRRGRGLLEDNTETKAVINGRGTSYWVQLYVPENLIYKEPMIPYAHLATVYAHLASCVNISIAIPDAFESCLI